MKDMTETDAQPRIAVLCSGGLDSAVLLASEISRLSVAQNKRACIQPIYVSSGFSWEQSERTCTQKMLQVAPFVGEVEPLAELECPITDTYPEAHWALTGNAPAYNTDDQEVYLIGRNILLLAKVSAYCAINQLEQIAVGPLAGNPFPDATPEFFSAMERALQEGLDHTLKITAPFRSLTKEEVIERGLDLSVPFQLTLSCMDPVDDKHCGRCSKCRERLQAFSRAHLDDPAPYAFRPKNPNTGR